MPSRIFTAFVLGAGKGTRLLPLTEHTPKPLLPVAGRPMITHAFDHLIAAGTGRFIVNTHHCASRYQEVFPDASYRGCPITFVHEPTLLDTAGGLKNIEPHLSADDETLWVYNGDILSTLPLDELANFHEKGSREVSLALRSTGGNCNVGLAPDGSVRDLRSSTGATGVTPCLFTGIYLVDRAFFRRMEAGRIESVVDVFLRAILSGEDAIGGCVIDEGQWSDVGTHDQYHLYSEENESSKNGPNSDAKLGESEKGGSPELRKLTEHVLSLDPSTPVEFHPIFKGGSERAYYRITMPGREACILMVYSQERQENARFATIAQFLHEVGVNAPRIFHHDEQRRLAWMQDLGETDLHSLRHDPWPERRKWYLRTLETVRQLHRHGIEKLKASGVVLMPGFDMKLYRWEHSYFLENGLQAACGLSISEKVSRQLSGELEALATRLCSLPVQLVHRDFQSENVLLSGEKAYLIDFQGMREGTLFYDLGSLLFDPYVPFELSQRLEMLDAYRAFDEEASAMSSDEFRHLFFCASVQRLLQALGAYGFLGLKKEKKSFLAHIPPALDNLSLAACSAGGFPTLLELVREAREGYSDAC